MTPTLDHIAAIAGVSRATVSRVVNEYPGISPELRERVLRILQEHNYQPHVAARALVTRRSNIIALVIPAQAPKLFTDPWFGLFIQGVVSACNRRGYSVVLVMTDTPGDHETVYARVARTGFVDGAIVASAPLDDPAFASLTASQMPFIVVGRPPVPYEAMSVDIDNVDAARRMTEYLIGLGHRRIATLTGVMSESAAIDRLEGYRQALTHAGISVDESLIACGEYSEEPAVTALTEILPHRPTAIFCANDVMACAVIRSLRGRGLLVPEDVSVCGFDDITYVAGPDISLTTVRQPVTQLGDRAVSLLLDALGPLAAKATDVQRDGHQRVVLPTQIVVRATTGPAPAHQ